MVPTGSNNVLAIGRKPRTPNLIRVAFEDSQQAAVGTIPYPRRFVIAGGDNIFAVRREGRVLNVVCMTLESGQQPTVFGVPYPGSMIIAGAENTPPVGGVPYHLNRTFVLEDSQWFGKCLRHGKMGFFRFGYSPAAYGQIERLAAVPR